MRKTLQLQRTGSSWIFQWNRIFTTSKVVKIQSPGNKLRGLQSSFYSWLKFDYFCLVKRMDEFWPIDKSLAQISTNAVRTAFLICCYSSTCSSVVFQSVYRLTSWHHLIKSNKDRDNLEAPSLCPENQRCKSGAPGTMFPPRPQRAQQPPSSPSCRSHHAVNKLRVLKLLGVLALRLEHQWE